MLTTEWVFCLICGNKTRLQIREDSGASLSIYAQEHRGSAGPHQRRGILQGVFGKAGTVIRHISLISYSLTGQASPALRQIGGIGKQECDKRKGMIG